MKKNLLTAGFVLLALSVVSGPVMSQKNSLKLNSDFDKKMVKVQSFNANASYYNGVKPLAKKVTPKAALEAGYYLPYGVSYMTWNVEINKVSTMPQHFGQFKTGPIMAGSWNTEYKFEDASTGAEEYSWTIPGGDPASTTDQDAIVTYQGGGEFGFPTQKVTAGSNMAEYTFFKNDTLNRSLKIGGESEIWNMVNMDEDWGINWSWKGGGFVFGSGPDGDDQPMQAYANLYAVPGKVTVKGVSIYTWLKSSAGDALFFEDPNKLIKVELIKIVPGSESLEMGETLATKTIKAGDFKAANETTGFNTGKGLFMFDGNGVQVENYFMIKLSDIPYGKKTSMSLMVSATPFYPSSSYAWVLMDDGSYQMGSMPDVIKGIGLSDVKDLSFMFGAIVEYPSSSEGGIIASNATATSNFAYVTNNAIVLSYTDATQAYIYNSAGQLMSEVSLNANGGTQTVSASSAWNMGAYYVKYVGANGASNTVKVLK